jgi:hypothetical protein
MTTAFIGLLSGVLGASITGVVAYFLQRSADERRFRHEKESKLREERREAYTDYLATCDRVFAGTTEEADAEFRLKLGGVRLVSTSKPVYDAAMELARFLYSDSQEDKEDEDRNSGPRSFTYGQFYGQLFTKFVDAAQRDLGIDPTRSELRSTEE